MSGLHYAKPRRDVKPKLTKVACWALARTPLGLGRGLFFGSDNGARAAAILTSFITTRKRLRYARFVCQRDISGRIRAHPGSRANGQLPDYGKAAQNHTQNIPA